LNPSIKTALPGGVLDLPGLAPFLNLTQTRHGPMLHLVGDCYIGRSLCFYGEYSREEMLLFQQLLKPGDIVVEAGANIGALTLGLAQAVGPAGKVAAFEPQPFLHRLLSANMLLNGLWNVDALQIALGREAGTLNVQNIDYTRESNFGNIQLQRSGGQPVQVQRLDSYGLVRLDLLKIDVEGMEKDVLLGAQDIIARCRPVLYVEHDTKDETGSVIQLMWSMQYRLWYHVPLLFTAHNFRGEIRNFFIQNLFEHVASINRACPV
jgi:FkbM family methyltransferase